LTATIEGLLATAWFAWARADASPSVESWFAVGGVAGLLVACAGVGIAASGYGRSTPVGDAALRRRYDRIVAAELVLIAAGAAALAALGLSRWIPAWLCAGIGLQFIPASRIFRTPFLALIGLVITCAAAAAVVAGLATTVTPSVVAGSGAGACLLITSLGSLVAGVSAGRRVAGASGGHERTS